MKRFNALRGSRRDLCCCLAGGRRLALDGHNKGGHGIFGSHGTSTTENGAPGSAGGTRNMMNFAFQRLTIDTSTNRPEACLVFSRELDTSGNTKYADYLKVDPEIAYSVRVNGSSLCLGGLSYGDKYTVTIKSGPSVRRRRQDGVRRNGAGRLTDRPPGVSFSGGIILPRESEGKVPSRRSTSRSSRSASCASATGSCRS